MSEQDSDKNSFHSGDGNPEEQKKPAKTSEQPRRDKLEDKKKNKGAEVLETSEGIMASDHIEKAKKDNAKLVNEF